MSLVAIQNRLKTLVEAVPLLAGRPVLVEDKNNLVSVVETTLQTQSLAIVIGPQSGSAMGEQARKVSQSEEIIEVVIHRGLLDDDTVPSTVEVLDVLRPALHGAKVEANLNPVGPVFKYLGHELRELGDGTYARVLRIGATD